MTEMTRRAGVSGLEFLVLVLILAVAGYLWLPRFFFPNPPFAVTPDAVVVGDAARGDEVRFARGSVSILEGTVFHSLPLEGLVAKAGAKRLLWLLKEADFQEYRRRFKNRAACPDPFLKPRIMSVTVLTDDAALAGWLSSLREGAPVRMRGAFLKLLSVKIGGGVMEDPAQLAPDHFNTKWFLLQERL